mmetsp:Transcript_12629/g.21823  ORF Transcript_12629/g.21823 Transcript_12629/m.21823 type:complete len:88 (+) Transcript_12629:479-742(+)
MSYCNPHKPYVPAAGPPLLDTRVPLLVLSPSRFIVSFCPVPSISAEEQHMYNYHKPRQQFAGRICGARGWSESSNQLSLAVVSSPHK